MRAEVGAEHLHIRAEQHEICAQLLLIGKIIEQPVGFQTLASIAASDGAAQRVRSGQLLCPAVIRRELLRECRFEFLIVSPAAAYNNGKEVQREAAQIQKQDQRQYGSHVADERAAQLILKRFAVHGRPSLSRRHFTIFFPF